jgi:hypothetical protein
MLTCVEINLTNMSSASNLFHQTTPSHASSNITEYEIAVTRVWPVVLLFGQNTTQVAETVTSCVTAANGTTEGSVAVSSVPGAKKSDAMRVSGAWASVILGCAIAFVL